MLLFSPVYWGLSSRLYLVQTINVSPILGLPVCWCSCQCSRLATRRQGPRGSNGICAKRKLFSFFRTMALLLIECERPLHASISHTLVAAVVDAVAAQVIGTGTAVGALI